MIIKLDAIKGIIELPIEILEWSEQEVAQFKAEFDALYSGKNNREIPGRCYLRGFTPLAIFNTVCGCLFGQVLVRVVDTDTRTIRWYWDVAVKHPPEAA